MSKYRNLFPNEAKDRYIGLNVGTHTVESPGLAASLSHVAAPWGMGAGVTTAVISIDALQIRSPPTYKCINPKGAVQDLAFSPFHDNLLGIAGTDGALRLWKLPGELSQSGNGHEPLCTCTGHSKKIIRLSFNPSAEWVAATSSADNSARFWDVEHAKTLRVYDHPALVSDIQWDDTGSLVGITAKDRFLAILDPRISKPCTAAIVCHDGARCASLKWLGGPNASETLILTAGFEKGPGKECKLWDTRHLGSQLETLKLDSEPGHVIPEWDPESCLAFVTSKGNSIIRVLELRNQALNLLGEYRSSEPCRAWTFVPKRAVHHSRNEIMRMLCANAPQYIQPIEWLVPHKSIDIHETNLYDCCLAGEPAVNCRDWLSTPGIRYAPKRAKMEDTTGEGFAFTPHFIESFATSGAPSSLVGIPLPSSAQEKQKAALNLSLSPESSPPPLVDSPASAQVVSKEESIKSMKQFLADSMLRALSESQADLGSILGNSQQQSNQAAGSGAQLSLQSSKNESPRLANSTVQNQQPSSTLGSVRNEDLNDRSSPSSVRESPKAKENMAPLKSPLSAPSPPPSASSHVPSSSMAPSTTTLPTVPVSMSKQTSLVSSTASEPHFLEDSVRSATVSGTIYASVLEKALTNLDELYASLKLENSKFLNSKEPI